MAEFSITKVKALREKTQAGILDCKKALQETSGDLEKAVEYLRKKGIAKAAKRAGKKTAEGRVHSYIHGDGKVGVLVEVNCETDFVARNEAFKKLVNDIALQICASAPLFIRREDIPKEIIEKEREIYRSQAASLGKPEKIVEKIVDGKMEKYYRDVCLIEQKFIKNEDISIHDLITDMIARTGENITISRFCRFQLGEASSL